MSSKATISCILAAVAFSVCAPVAAQSFPSKPLLIILPYTPGASADTTMRLLNQKVSESIGQTVRIENRPGGGGVIGAMAVKHAAPDGYTLLQANISSHAANPSLMPKLPYDPLRDFKPVTLLWTFPSFLVVPGSANVKSVADLVTLARSRPGGLNYVSTGNATGGHLLGEMLKNSTRVPMVHIPHKGAAPAIVDLIAGRADFYFVSYAAVATQVADGKVRPIAVATQRRLERFPAVPTIAEAGYPNVEYLTWFGLVAPAGTPDPLIARLNEEFTKAARSPELVKRMADDGLDLSPTTPAGFGALMARDIERLRKVIADAGARLE